MAAITSVLDEFAGLERRVHHIIGNHCLYNLPRQELNERLGVLPFPTSASNQCP